MEQMGCVWGFLGLCWVALALGILAMFVFC